MGITRGTETVRFDKPTRLILEDMGKKRGTTWGQVARQLVNEGISRGFEVEEMARGLETVEKTLEEVSAKNETLAKAAQTVSDSVRYLPKLQNLEELKTLPATTQEIDKVLARDREETQRMLMATHQHLTGLYNTNVFFYAFAGFVVGILFAVALYLAFK